MLLSTDETVITMSVLLSSSHDTTQLVTQQSNYTCSQWYTCAHTQTTLHTTLQQEASDWVTLSYYSVTTCTNSAACTCNLYVVSCCRPSHKCESLSAQNF